VHGEIGVDLPRFVKKFDRDGQFAFGINHNAKLYSPIIRDSDISIRTI